MPGLEFDVPKPPLTPLELLTRKDYHKPSVLEPFYMPAIFGTLGILSCAYHNQFTGRPYLSGLPRYVFVTGAFAVAGKYLNDFRNQYLAERDAVFRHYVSLHPEDFPPYERKTFGEIFEKWEPIR